MPINYPAILELKESGKRYTFTDRDTMLYALGIGLGGDPDNADELPFVYEKDLRAVPTQATVVAWGAGVPTNKLGVNYKLVLHGEEKTVLHRPFPPEASIIADSGVVEVYDKGEGKGAIIVRETVLRDEGDGGKIATLIRTIVARGDGGSGGSSEPTPTPHPTPDREPDNVVEYTVAGNQAAIYRLSGDRNPLHIDPDRGKAAGFDGPILHGLCTYGFTCRAVLEAYCDFDPDRIASHQARFSAVVFPGDKLRINLWKEDDETISFQAEVPNRGKIVIKNGLTKLRVK
ncbi:MaoC family dehydratase [Hyphomonas johnsonii]|uniref:3-alpha,7-alpha, 12-alpha-trihydroxy-5-beta-cholest-24-enoyl-CoA hydratase n=1 Tax=Hyphomonas johnsonii MHS-2 TaxID=1280950 RepID=A0A059FU92_9PROT|nr:MaoC family dehydratase [Hyphomonas johnsonii]KCZ94249.1 3-alpha,7-alpha,12-alpha-trihydroxy-5-beta-cholest-24-enoyl-CoA hydratase [Hyphomonas johnsonii MHS-2]